jgi:hypothetical protein
MTQHRGTRAMPERNALKMQHHEDELKRKIHAGLKLIARRLAEKIIAERARLAEGDR